ncbi:MAG: chemotaxis protein CheB [Beggiatoa sp. IS2]|nr:MAG: chemotaxis protein CheB [Beggiatoa sp. IS2]
MDDNQSFAAIVVGSSAGGIRALSTLLTSLPGDFPLPIIIVQHVQPDADSYLATILDKRSALTVKQADDKEFIHKGTVYLAPPNYHLLIEEDRSFSLSLEGLVNFSRPSIDVLFESAVYAYRNQLIGIILTGANHDGSQGLKKIKQFGGYAIVQDPDTAEADAMPRSAIAATKVDKILPVERIGGYLLRLLGIFAKMG